MKEWISFIFTKKFVKHTFLMLVAFIVFVLLLFQWFKIYSQHGKSLTLNDLNELTLDQAVEVLESKGLNYFIVDSISFNPDFLPLAVIQQNPAPESKVKEGRTIYLWLNAGKPPFKTIPYLSDNAQLSEAYDRLSQVGFDIGEITYKPDADIVSGEPIRRMEIDGIEVKKGDKAQYGTKIDLIVGTKAGANKVKVPLLLGKTLAEAEFLMNADLNFGTILYDSEGLIDSSSAVIIKQLPDFGNEEIRVGTTIDIWIKQDLPEEISERLEQIKLEGATPSVDASSEE